MSRFEVIDRSAARTAGLTHYFTGKPCVRGHLAQRRITTTKCWECERSDDQRRAQRRYYSDNHKLLKQKGRGYHQRARLAALIAYGGQCGCCGEAQLEFLCLHHINGGGSRHRRTESAAKLIRRLAREDFPRGEYHVLCHNCNFAMWAYGVCPHQQKD